MCCVCRAEMGTSLQIPVSSPTPDPPRTPSPCAAHVTKSWKFPLFFHASSVVKCRCSGLEKSKLQSSRYTRSGGFVTSSEEKLSKSCLDAFRSPDCPTSTVQKLAGLTSSFSEENEVPSASGCAEWVCSAQGLCRTLCGSSFSVFPCY